MGKILAFFVGAAHVAVTHCHGLDAVFLEERLHLALHFRVRRDIGGNPALNDRLGPVAHDHTGSNLGRPFVIGTVKCDRADGIFERFSVFGLELFDGVLPLVKFGVRKKVLILFRNQPAGFLEGVDDRRVDPSRFHVLDYLVFQVFGMRHVVAQLLATLRNPEVRNIAARTLGEIGSNSPEAVNTLIDVLKNDAAREARRSAAGALGAFGPAAKAAIPVLREALKGDAIGGWWVAADALARIGGAEVVPALIEAMANPDADVRLTSMRGLGKLGVVAGPARIALEKARLEDTRESNRAAAAEALRKIEKALATMK